LAFFSLVVLCFSLYFLSANVEAKSTYGSSRIMRRGFKSSLLSTARGFGKRSDDSLLRPTDYLAQEAIRNPQVLNSILAMLDSDSDGMITPMEIEAAYQN